MAGVSVLLNLTNGETDPVVTHHNDSIILAFYQGEYLILQLELNKEDLWAFPDSLLKEMKEKTTDEWEEECLRLSYENKELKEQIEAYEENFQEYKDKLLGSCGPF